VCRIARVSSAWNGKEVTEVLVFSVTGKRFVEHYDTQDFDMIIAAGVLSRRAESTAG